MKYVNPFLIMACIFCCPLLSVCQLQFIENKGQWEKQVNFKHEFATGAFFIEAGGFSVVQHKPEDLSELHDFYHGESKTKKEQNALTVKSHAVKVSLLQASTSAIPTIGQQLAGINNYFIGNDRSKWQGGCRSLTEVTYKNIYPFIDVRYYFKSGQLKYDFIVHPGGNPKKIQLQYSGQDAIRVKKNELILSTSAGDIKEMAPYSYQQTSGGVKPVACNYHLAGSKVSFDVGHFDATKQLIIDPTLIFSSFTGSTADNWGNSGAPGPDGSFFSIGQVYGTGYPVSPGAFSQTFNGGLNDDPNGPYDIGLFKFSPDGTSRLYATYLGGNGNETPISMISDALGNLIICGRTNSTNYPVTTPLVGQGGGLDIFTTKLNRTGTALMGSVKIGGSADDGVNMVDKYATLPVPGQTDGAYDTRRNYSDDSRGDILVDDQGNIYVATCTKSTNFPVTAGAIQPVFGGGGSFIQQDGLILKFNANLSTVIFATFFGGNGNDACFNLALNKTTGDLYVSGATTSANLPGNRVNALTPNYQGGVTDGFITSLKADGSFILKTTYDGTSGNDMIYGMQLDKNGFVYINGTTTVTRPVVNAAFSQPGAKQFIRKLDADLSSLLYSTNYGTNASASNICPVAFHVDRCENVYVSGWGGVFSSQKGYPNAGTTGLTVTSNALKATTDGNDFYFFVLQKNAASQLYGSFFGQQGGFTDHADGGGSRFDENDVLYQTICANCSSPGVVFPTTSGVWSPSNLSSSCNQAAVKINMNFERVVSSGLKASIGGVAKDTGCLPATFLFTDTLRKARKYTWSFGDGSPSQTVYAPVDSFSHTYNFPGTFRVMLVAEDSLSCNLADTTVKFITANSCSDSLFCNSSDIYLTSNVTGLTYQWQRDTGSGFQNIADDAFFGGSQTSTLHIKSAPTSWYGIQFRCTVDGVAGSEFKLKFVNYWTGAVNNQWELAANWSCGKVPDNNTDVFINQGSPILNSNTVIRTLSAANGSNVVINAGFNLLVLH